jgi:predicted PurR-regulated permease PerM
MIASFALVAAILYFAKAVFIPIGLALLFTFLLSPLVLRLQRWRFPKPVAIITTVTFAFGLLAFITWLVATQLIGLAAQLPSYEQNLHAKIERLKGTSRPGVFTRAAEIITGVQKNLEAPGTPETATPPTGTSDKPVPVEVKAPKPTAWQVARRSLGPLLGPAGTGGIVVILVLAMLFKREDLRDRFIKVISGGQLNRATEAVDDAARRISRYLLMLLVVNVTYGIPIGVGLYFIGVPNPLLWGLLATLLRFIPFLGPWIAALFPVALAFAVDPGWTKLILTVALFLVIELVSNNLVEPWLYGASTGVSPVAVIAGALFWTWLWGAIGLFLCTPLTVCLVVMGKYVPGLKAISDMFGSEPVLEPHARFYQRMLAMDSEEMLRLAEEFVEAHDLVAFYDQVMVPALIMAEEDRQTGRLAEMRQQFIVQNSRELIEDLGERECLKRGVSATGRPAEIMCLPARDDADEIAALMLVQALRAEGVPADLASPTLLPEQCEKLVRGGTARAVVISALPPDALAPGRRLCRKIKQSCPSIPVIVGLWTPNSAGTEISQRLAAANPDAVVTTLKGAVQQLTARSNPQTDPENARVLRRVNNVRSGEFTGREPEEMFDAIKRETARVFNVPLAFVSLVQLDAEFWKMHRAIPREAEETSRLLQESAVCSQLADGGSPVVVEDVSKVKQLAEDPFLLARGIQSYLAAPLATDEGHVIGSLCVLDTKPREFGERELRRLQSLSRTFIKAIEARPVQTA